MLRLLPVHFRKNENQKGIKMLLKRNQSCKITVETKFKVRN